MRENLLYLSFNNLYWFPCFRWFRDNDEILDNEVFSTLPSGDLEVAGLLSSLLFTVSTSTQNVKFHCEVTNEHGKDTSGLLTLKLAQQTESNLVMRRFSKCHMEPSTTCSQWFHRLLFLLCNEALQFLRYTPTDASFQ